MIQLNIPIPPHLYRYLSVELNIDFKKERWTIDNRNTFGKYLIILLQEDKHFNNKIKPLPRKNFETYLPATIPEFYWDKFGMIYFSVQNCNAFIRFVENIFNRHLFDYIEARRVKKEELKKITSKMLKETKMMSEIINIDKLDDFNLKLNRTITRLFPHQTRLSAIEDFCKKYDIGEDDIPLSTLIKRHQRREKKQKLLLPSIGKRS